MRMEVRFEERNFKIDSAIEEKGCFVPVVFSDRIDTDEPEKPDIPDVPDIPEEPEIVKLDTPVIYLETITVPDEPDVPDVPDIPDEPEEPEIVKLAAPVIYLESKEAVETGTPAILGVAVLGKTILGVINVDEPDEPEIVKLAAPVIRLETIAEPDEPEEPEIVKLAAPVIYLEAIADPEEPEIPDEPEEPEIVKLAAPVIYLEAIADPEEPEEPEIVKLDTPVIHLEATEDPEEPEEPEIVKLDTPVISLETIASKNNQLLDMSGAKGGTANGITVDVYDDESYLLSGTAELDYSNVWLLGGYSSTKTLFTLPAGRYYVSGADLFTYDGTTRNVYRNAFTLAEETAITAVRVPTLEKGKTYNDRIYPMLNAGTEPLPWEPYDNGTNVEPDVPELPKLDAPDVYIVEGEDITDQFTWNNNGGVNSYRGTIENSGILKYSDPVDVSGAEKITLAFMDLTAHDGNVVGYGLVFFDESGTYISGYGFQKGNTEPGKGERTILTVDIPEGAATIKTTYAMDEETYGAFFAYVVMKPVDTKLGTPEIRMEEK